MKKLLIMSVAVLALSATSALADNHGEVRDGKGGMFQKHDTNGDGVISKAEFLSHAEERFGAVDMDGNGEISKEEAQAKRAEMKEKRQEKRETMKEKRQERREGAAEGVAE